MSRGDNELDRLRSGRTELENHYIDELVSGRLNRRDFLRRGSMIGMSAPLLGAILAACGSSSKSTSSSAAGSSTSSAPATKGGTLRIGAVAPAAAINPLTISDAGGLLMLNQTGEFLIFDSNLKLELQPMLALSWSPNTDGSVWTFKLRPGVKFHNGAAMTADDVVYTFQQLSDPKNASNALSAFTGVLSPSGVKAVDPMTVQFTLEAPNGNFPYLVSSDNYNAIIVPKGTNFGSWQSTFIGTGAFILSKYTQGVGASFTPNPNYWGTKPLLDSTTFNFYTSQAPMILALQGNSVDVIAQFTPSGAAAILNSPSYKIISLKSANHRELSMRNDIAPFTDARVRQAVAYTLDRVGAVAALLSGKGTVANDYPFGPRFPSTDTSVPQRTQNIAMAKQLLSAAGHPNGFSTTLKTEVYQEIPELAQVIVEDAREPDAVLRQGDVWELRLARWHDEPCRLRRPRRTERVPDRAADEQRAMERGQVQEPDIRQSGQAVRRRARPHTAADDRREDPAAAARRDADRLPILDRRPDRVDAGRRRAQPDLDRAALPEHRVQVGLRLRTTWSGSSSSGSASR